MTPASLAIIVPVLGRPGNVAPLVESWHQVDDNSQLVFVATATDDLEIEALRKADVDFLVTYSVTWPQKINYAVRVVDADWYLFGADDITFERHWFANTAKARAHAGVVGTNDGANPRCIAGEHSTHTLVSREYIRAHGTIDADEAVCSFYRHWFVDDELIWTAKSRDQWAHSGVLVQHHHPYFDDTVAMDDTYKLGESRSSEDFQLWKQRAAMLGLSVS